MVEAEVQAVAGPSFDSSRFELLSQGAEARVWTGTFLQRPVVVKQRFPKAYRHPALDAKLTQQRLKAEVRGLLKARKLGVSTPVLFHVDTATACIYMERLEGSSVKHILHSQSMDDAATNALLQGIGQTVAKLHDAGLVHGDLTTSNMVVRTVGNNELVLIDFGLSQNSSLPEDKGVDLYVLERAFLSAHAEKGPELFDVVLQSYRRSSKFWSATLNRFAEVRARGRKRAMVG
ncbi:CGL126 [Auxenochlorella protothecoides x Auxenochlorella symbiontica]|uniref:non-specific serine/threonine protein kinase n=1 Tax=Auxenochlorella protothecoides TaxID=3075 RepID=A0A087SSF3_AUXPR|nr:TP53-regulating kinase [Auxenochlorella protothecoides]KFM28657.1 TP53-regulating kinase [Auxenochlorella protothecoides]RMZ55530.1 hypothetical protein APUTEX25_000113 [Auxenochlorella protothecoides]|eukprot:RMZ55530.1 hypothetical protein APUTEX25_000113 [Auxenochlorella protothecoides]